MEGNSTTDTYFESFSTEETEDFTTESDSYSLTVQLVASFIIVALTACNIIGNTCTLLAFYQDPKLRTPHNCYIANLAVTDLTVGFISVPFYAVYTLRKYYWQFGYLFCKIWCVVDFWICAESALTIALISQDRFLLVKDGALYNQKHTRQGAVVKIAISWLLSGLLYSPAIIGFNIWRGHSTVEVDDCDVEFATDFWYTIVTAIIEFLVPAVLLIVFNVYIFWKIRQRAMGKARKELKPRAKSPPMAKDNNGHTNAAFSAPAGDNGSKNDQCKAVNKGTNVKSEDINEVNNPSDKSNGNEPGMLSVKIPKPGETSNGVTKSTLRTGCGTDLSSLNSTPVTREMPSSGSPKETQSSTHHPNGTSPATSPTEKKQGVSVADKNMKRYRKAARSLAMLVIAFSICWLPYVVSTLILSVCDTCVNQDLFEAFNWLLWLNSSVNPFLYAAMNPLFRKHYKRILCTWRMCPQRRRNIYQEGDTAGGTGSAIEPSDTNKSSN